MDVIQLIVYCSYRLLWCMMSVIHNLHDRWILQHGKAFTIPILVRRKFPGHPFDFSRAVDFLGFPSWDNKNQISIESEILAENSKWTLYTVSETHVYFVTDNKSRLTDYTALDNPFMYLTQFTTALTYVRLPVHTFCELAKMRHPERPIVYMSDTARSGTTLLARLLQTHPNTVVLSEPDVFTWLALLIQKGTWPKTDQLKLISAVVAALCNQLPSGKTAILKTRSTGNVLVPLIKECCPSVKHLFIYRANLSDVIKSTEKMITPANAHLRLYDRCPRFAAWLIGTVNADAKFMAKFHPRSLYELSCLIFGAPFARYIDHESMYDFVCTYEELIDQPIDTLKGIIEELGLDKGKDNKLHENAIQTVLSEDSQANTELSRSNMEKMNVSSDPDGKEKCDNRMSELAELLKLPVNFFRARKINEQGIS